MAITSTSTLDSRRTELELPEEIDLQLETANVGSRTLAILIDIALCGLTLFVVYSITLLLARDATTDWITRLGSNTMTTLLLLLIFGFQWGYFNFFEWVWNGQTPGKRLMHLRVIKVDGRAGRVDRHSVAEHFPAHRHVRSNGTDRPVDDLRQPQGAAARRSDGAHAGHP